MKFFENVGWWCRNYSLLFFSCFLKRWEGKKKNFSCGGGDSL